MAGQERGEQGSHYPIDFEGKSPFEKLKEIGRGYFQDLQTNGPILPADVARAREFISTAAHEINPPVTAGYWEHVTIAPQLGNTIAKNAAEKGIPVDPNKIEFLLTLHDIGRLATAGADGNDLLVHELYDGMQIPDQITNDLPSVQKLSVASKAWQLTDEQPLTQEQQAGAESYFKQLSPTQLIINLADTLGKRDGKLFTPDTFKQYLIGQQASNVLQYLVIEKTINWLKDQGVEIQDVFDSMQDYAPKFVVVARHGELHNPSGLVYGRDKYVADPGDIVHTSNEGREQMKELGETIQAKRFHVAAIALSPETRAIESKDVLNAVLNIDPDNISIDPDIDDIDSEEPIRLRMTMEQLRARKGYSRAHALETGIQIRERMQRAFSRIVEKLLPGQTGILISHGDPIAYLLNYQLLKRDPDPSALRNLMYPGKGNAAVVVLDPKGEFFTSYFLIDPQKRTSTY